MKIKSKLAVCAACVVLAGVLTVPALAHGHHGRARSNYVYPQCQVEDCQLTYRHDHDGETYCGHSRGDGHSHHVDCDVSGCTVLGAHTHRAHGHGRHHC